MIITIWERWNPKTERFEHNHIEDGYQYDILAPSPKFPSQNCWIKAHWLKKKGYLINHVVKEI